MLPPPSRTSIPSSTTSSSTALVALNPTTQQPQFDAIITSQHTDKIIHSKFSDLVEKDANKVIKTRPTEETEAEVTARTKAALEALVNQKIASSKATTAAAQAAAVHRPEEAQIIRYTPEEHTAGYTKATKQRIVKLVEAPVDPLERSRFRLTKAPPKVADAPVPIMHSPTRKTTLTEQDDWKIPPAISNWKNSMGHVIPLDKRVAADGRTLLEPTINDGFAKFSEALLIAERKARAEVETRAAIQQKLALKAKEEKEEEIRKIAAKARMERSGIADLSESSRPMGSHLTYGFEGEQLDDAVSTRGSTVSLSSSTRPSSHQQEEEEEEEHYLPPKPQAASESDADYQARLERERIRREARREKEREIRAEHSGKRSKQARDNDRDMSERIALGMAVGPGGNRITGEAMYDARLFNQSEGISGSLGDEEGYNVYDKPWRGGDNSVASAIYRPRSDMNSSRPLSDADATAAIEGLRDGANKRFKADSTDFEGVRNSGMVARTGPIEFERGSTTGSTATSNTAASKTVDPFGLDSILGGKGSTNKRVTALDSIGQGPRGYMSASGGGGSRETGGSGRTSIAFTPASNK